MNRIIVIDDEKHIGESIKRLLEEDGYKCEAYHDAERGLARLVTGETVDLILLDVWMPVIDGYTLLKKLSAAGIETPVIVMSGHANISLSTHTLKSGAVDFIEKPFSSETLLYKIRHVLEKKETNAQTEAKIPLPDACLLKTKRPQRTIQKDIVLNGIGLHSGRATGLIISPLPADSGIIFEDIATGYTLPALAQHVTLMHYATTLECSTFKVSVVEHLLASLHIYGIDNVRVKVSGEVPILDGSAIRFCQAIEDAGVLEQADSTKRVFVPQETYEWTETSADAQRSIKLAPYNGFKISYHLDLPKEYGDQYHEVDLSGSDRIATFKNEIAPCRTFGFLDETRHLQSSGMALGANLGNALLLHENKVVNSELRFPNEFARHKIIDILGDLYLLGSSLQGEISAYATGHRHNVSLIKKIIKQFTPISLTQ